MHYGKKEFADAWASYKEALTASPSLHLSQFCADNGYLISGMRKWMRRHGISLKQAKEDAAARQAGACQGSTEAAFVEIKMPQAPVAVHTVRIDGLDINAAQTIIHVEHMECSGLGALLRMLAPCSR